MKRGAPLLLAVLLAGCPRSAAGLLDHADKLEGRRDFPAALAAYRDALRRLDTDRGAGFLAIRTRALAHLADLCYLDMGDTRCAADAYRRLLERHPDAPESHQARIHYAEMLRDRGDWTDAIAQYEALVSAYPEAPGAPGFKLQAAQGYFELGDYPQAATEARALLERFPRSAEAPSARFLLAGCHEMQGHRAEAMAAYQELIDRAPPPDLLGRAQFSLGQLLERTGENERALAILVSSLRTHPDPLLVRGEIERLERKMADEKRLAEHPDAFHDDDRRADARRPRPASGTGD